MFTRDGLVYAWLIVKNSDDALEEVLYVMSLSQDNNYGLSYSPALDGCVEVVVPAGTTYDVVSPHSNLLFAVTKVGIDLASSKITASERTTTGTGSALRYVYTFDLLDRPWLIGSTLVYGQAMPRYLDPTPPVVRKGDGTPRSDIQLVVRAYYIDYLDSGQFKAQMLSKYRGDADIANTDWFPLDDDPEHPFEESVRTGTLQVPWGEYANLAGLRVYSDDIRPTTIQEIRYDPEYLKAGG